MTLEIAKQMTEAAPVLLALLPTVPILSAVIFKFSAGMRAVRVETQSYGYAWPGLEANSPAIKSDDGVEVMVPSGSDAIIDLSDGRALEIHDYRLEHGNSNGRNAGGNAVVILKNGASGQQTNLSTIGLDEWIAPGVTATYQRALSNKEKKIKL